MSEDARPRSPPPLRVRDRAHEPLGDPAKPDRVLAVDAGEAASAAEKALANAYNRVGLLRRG